MFSYHPPFASDVPAPQVSNAVARVGVREEGHGKEHMNYLLNSGKRLA
jgi:hypothetical protein